MFWWSMNTPKNSKNSMAICMKRRKLLILRVLPPLVPTTNAATATTAATTPTPMTTGFGLGAGMFGVGNGASGFAGSVTFT